MSKKNKEITLYDIYTVVTRNQRDISFWEENSSLTEYSPYKELIESEGLDRSATIMDAIWHVYDRKSKANQKAKNKPEEIKQLKDKTAAVLFPNEEFEFDDYEGLIESYINDTMSELESNVEFYASKVRELRKHIDKLSMDSDASDVADLMKDYHILLAKQTEHQVVLNTDRRSVTLRKGVVLHRVERL